MPLFKVWNGFKKKCVVASTLADAIASGTKKLNLENTKEISVYLEDGTEIDEEDVFQELSPGTILYLLNEDDEKPWEWKTVETVNERFVNPESAVELVPETAVQIEQDFENKTSSLNISAIKCQLLRPWPKQFHVPQEKFSEELHQALQAGNLVWSFKSELLGHLSREISKYTFKPSVKQRDEVAKELISLYPALKSNIGEGFHGWSQKIYDKMCEEARKRNGTRKRLSTSGTPKNVKLPRRGEINFEPNIQIDPGQISIAKKILSDEFVKSPELRNSQLIEENLTITFSDRRQLIAQNALVTDLKREYEILFTEIGLKNEFKFINGFELEPRFLKRLNDCSEKVVEEAIILKSKVPKKHAELNKVLTDSHDSEITALRLLPVLLADNNIDCLYKVYSLETDVETVKLSGPATPHVAVLGSCNDECLCYIVVEKDIVLSVYGFVKAVMLMYAIYYCCNMQYASGAIRTLKFFQTYLLEMADASKLPTKLITFASKMP